MRCGFHITAAYTSLVHRCPKCKIVICHHCVEDFKLIIATYRCPHCGDEKANQAILKDTEWFRDFVRASRVLYRSLDESWAAMFASASSIDEASASALETLETSSQLASLRSGATDGETNFLQHLVSLWQSGGVESLPEDSTMSQESLFVTKLPLPLGRHSF